MRILIPRFPYEETRNSYEYRGTRVHAIRVARTGSILAGSGSLGILKAASVRLTIPQALSRLDGGEGNDL